MIDKCQVEIVDLKATYVRSAESRSAAILDGAELCGVEEFAARHFRHSGFDAIVLENTPFHVLFGVYMWMLIQDPCDPRVRMIAFGDRHAYGQRLPSKLIWTGQPQDFGTADYGRRRAKAITKHLSAISEDRVELHRLFDDWLAPSVGLRQYLWAHRQESIDTARKVIEIIPPPMLKNLLRYLVQNYRGRCTGWPDLLLYRGNLTCACASRCVRHRVLGLPSLARRPFAALPRLLPRLPNREPDRTILRYTMSGGLKL